MKSNAPTDQIFFRYSLSQIDEVSYCC